MAGIEEKTQQVTRMMVSLDLSFTIFTFLVSYWISKSFITEGDLGLFSHLALLPLILAFLLFFLPYFQAYRSPRETSVLTYLWSVLRAVVICIGLLLILLFVLNIQYVSRGVILIFSGIEVLILFGIRIGVVRHFIRMAGKGRKNYKILIIGTGYRATHLSEVLDKNTEWGIDIIGHLDPNPSRVGLEVRGSTVLGTVGDISHILKIHVVDEVILAIPRTMLEDTEAIAYACEEEGIKLRLMADVFDLQVTRWSLVELGEIPLLTLEPVALDEGMLIIKRMMDLTFTLLSIPVVLPLIGLIAIAVKFDSPGPVLFNQERVGFKKRLFTMIKFRSMIIGSEEMLKDIEHLNEAEGPVFKIKSDPRVTRVGRFLRKTSLDELPQLFNVLRGEMSLVGPRPMSIRDVELFDKGIQRKRFSVKPGLTCIWQISGRSNLPFHTWIELDLKYIETWSLWLDLKILLQTLPAVLMSKGAM
ncbi:sugar transferase [Thermodesulfobacteriota bacterium]